MHIDEQLQQQLAHELRTIIAGWTSHEVMTVMRLRPERISELRHGNLARFSVASLMRLIATHGYDIELVLRPRPRRTASRQQPSATVVRYDRFGQRSDTR